MKDLKFKVKSSGVFTAYFAFGHIVTKAMQRIDCTASTGSHPILNGIRKVQEQKPTEKRDGAKVGAITQSYTTTPDWVKSSSRRKPKAKITLTGLFPVVDNWYYGDFKHLGCNDLVVFNNTLQMQGKVIVGGKLEMFIAPNKEQEKTLILDMLINGEFEDEFESLRKQATAEPKPSTNTISYSKE